VYKKPPGLKNNISMNPQFSNLLTDYFLLYTGDPEVLSFIAHQIVPVGLVSGVSPGVVSQHGRMPFDGNTSSDFLSKLSSFRSPSNEYGPGRKTAPLLGELSTYMCFKYLFVGLANSQQMFLIWNDEMKCDFEQCAPKESCQ
jgi:hypothetical protein